MSLHANPIERAAELLRNAAATGQLSKRLDVLAIQSSNQAARIVGRVAAGGNTYHKPSSCRKKNIANDRPGSVDSTQTQRPSRYTLSLSWKRLMRIGDVSEGASHLSINLRKQYPS